MNRDGIRDFRREGYNKMKRKNQSINLKKVFLFVVLLLIVIIISYLIFFSKNTAKNSKMGNNNTSQDVVEKLINMTSYEADIEISIYSNKNTNKYKIHQTYESPDKNSQEVLEPSNIQGVKIVKEGNKLTLQNSKLNLTSIIENYQYLGDNSLDLNTFISDYQKDEKASIEEQGENIILKTEIQNNNPNIKYKILTIDKKTGKPINLEIKGTNQKNTIYILYNEVKISSNQEKNILAFKLYPYAKEM